MSFFFDKCQNLMLQFLIFCTSYFLLLAVCNNFHVSTYSHVPSVLLENNHECFLMTFHCLRTPDEPSTKQQGPAKIMHNTSLLAGKLTWNMTKLSHLGEGTIKSCWQMIYQSTNKSGNVGTAVRAQEPSSIVSRR